MRLWDDNYVVAENLPAVLRLFDHTDRLIVGNDYGDFTGGSYSPRRRCRCRCRCASKLPR